MNMVAAARLRSTQTKMENFEPYARKFAEVLGNLSGRIDRDVHPLLRRKEKRFQVELAPFHGGPRSLRQFQHEPHPAGAEVAQGTEGKGHGPAK
jgi:hypothetical protein